MTFGLAPLVSAHDAFTVTVDYDNRDFDIVSSVAELPRAGTIQRRFAFRSL